MMEFVTSRVTLVICGVILLAAVVTPMSQMLETDENSRLSETALNDARAIDALYDSDYDEMYLRGSVYLPSSSYWLELDGHQLTIHSNVGKTYTSAISHASEHLTLSYGDTVTFCRSNGMITVVD